MTWKKNEGLCLTFQEDFFFFILTQLLNRLQKGVLN